MTPHTWRDTLHEIIFEADTPSGKWFDVILIASIIFSVVVVMLDPQVQTEPPTLVAEEVDLEQDTVQSKVVMADLVSL